MGNDLKEILVTAEDMDRRLGEMAEQIDQVAAQGGEQA